MQLPILIYASGSQPFLPRGTLGQLYKYLAAPLDAKIGLKINKSDKGSSINDVTHFWTIFDPISPHRHAFYY